MDFVSADNYGRHPLIANRAAAGTWETYDELVLSGGYIALRSHANGNYVTAESAGTKPLVANRAAIGSWETFTLVSNVDGSESLLAIANHR